MRRILLLTTLAAMLAAAMALSGVAQAKPTIVTKADAKCLAEAAKTVQQPGFKPADYAFHGGDEGQNDFRFQGSADVPDVFCGFGGVDATSTLEAVDIFLGGEGDDEVGINNGTFYGQEGGDLVISNNGTFYGSEGNDTVSANESRGTFNGGEGDDFVLRDNTGTFNGGAGDDSVGDNSGTFNGEEGNDFVDFNVAGATFNGGDGDDSVDTNDGTFDGGAGDDFVRFNNLGTFDGGDGVDTVSAGCGPTMNVEFAPPPC